MDSIIELKIEDSHRRKAQKKYDALPKEIKQNGYNNLSYQSGDFLLPSFISEIVVCDYLGEGAKIKNTKDYDIVCNADNIDVKLKPNSDKPPKKYWNASVPSYQLKIQDCHGYIFTRINRNLTILWVMGIIGKNDFKNQAMYAEKGSYDGQWKWKVDSHYIKIEKLQPLSLYKEGKYVLQ